MVNAATYLWQILCTLFARTEKEHIQFTSIEFERKRFLWIASIIFKVNNNWRRACASAVHQKNGSIYTRDLYFVSAATDCCHDHHRHHHRHHHHHYVCIHMYEIHIDYTTRREKEVDPFSICLSICATNNDGNTQIINLHNVHRRRHIYFVKHISALALSIPFLPFIEFRAKQTLNENIFTILNAWCPAAVVCNFFVIFVHFGLSNIYVVSHTHINSDEWISATARARARRDSARNKKMNARTQKEIARERVS